MILHANNSFKRNTCFLPLFIPPFLFHLILLYRFQQFCNECRNDKNYLFSIRDKSCMTKLLRIDWEFPSCHKRQEIHLAIALEIFPLMNTLTGHIIADSVLFALWRIERSLNLPLWQDTLFQRIPCIMFVYR